LEQDRHHEAEDHLAGTCALKSPHSIGAAGMVQVSDAKAFSFSVAASHSQIRAPPSGNDFFLRVIPAQDPSEAAAVDGHPAGHGDPKAKIERTVWLLA